MLPRGAPSLMPHGTYWRAINREARRLVSTALMDTVMASGIGGLRPERRGSAVKCAARLLIITLESS